MVSTLEIMGGGWIGVSASKSAKLDSLLVFQVFGSHAAPVTKAQ